MQDDWLPQRSTIAVEARGSRTREKQRVDPEGGPCRNKKSQPARKEHPDFWSPDAPSRIVSPLAIINVELLAGGIDQQTSKMWGTLDGQPLTSRTVIGSAGPYGSTVRKSGSSERRPFLQTSSSIAAPPINKHDPAALWKAEQGAGVGAPGDSPLTRIRDASTSRRGMQFCCLLIGALIALAIAIK